MNHLESNVNCFQYYKTRFSAADWPALNRKLINLTRSSYSSRRTLKRQLEYAALNTRKKDSKTVTNSLNSYRLEVSLANYRFCIICQQNFCKSGAFEIKDSDSLYQQFDLENNMEFKRMNKFWCCHYCKSAGKKKNNSFIEPRLKSVIANGRKIVYPVDTRGVEEIELDTNTLIMIPVKPLVGRTMAKYSVLNMYQNQDPNNSFLSTMYLNRILKFEQRLLHCDLYEGEILRNQNKRLETVAKIIDTSMIRGSTSWNRKQRNNIYSQFCQFGQAAIGFSLRVDMNNIETYITTQLCEGRVVTVDQIGDINGEFFSKYYIHNHVNSQACGNNCIKSEVKELPEKLHPKFIPVFLASLSQKQSAYVEEFVKNNNFDLSGEDYHVGIDFNLDTSTRIKGLIWTRECAVFNEALSVASLNGASLKADLYLLYLEKSILTTVNSSDIRNTLDISEEETMQIQMLAQKYQVCMEMKESNIKLPSYETMYRVHPEHTALINLVSSKTMLSYFKAQLIQLSEEDKKSLTTEDWLRRLSKKAKFNMINENKISIQVENKKICFKLDDRLNDLMIKYDCFTGLYHYSLTCSKKEHRVVLKRNRILDCYTVPYNTVLLKAFQNTIETVPLYSIDEWWRFEEKYETEVSDYDSDELNNLAENHKLGTLTEIYALSDPNRIRDINSAPVEYVSAYEVNKPKFRKISVPTEDSYLFPGLGHFQQLSNNIHRHFSRLNGQHLLLVETVLWFDVLSQKDASDILSLYKEKLTKIPAGKVSGVYGQVIPTYIVCKNDQILKLRKRMKTLQIPQFAPLSKEFKFARVMLYFPLRPGQKIDSERLGLYIYKF